MKESVINNKRIAKNTFYLYLRMLFVMAISLYTVRAILDILGVVDYGIYNVVGGVVTMFAFMNRTLSTSSQRYFSIELARGDKDRLNKWFCLNITSFMMIGLIVAFFLETVGLWFLNSQMTIPAERLTAANVVFQLSIISFLFHIVSVPYLALIVAHEKMNVFAYVGIVEALGRLVIVFILMMLSYDKLIIYGILILFLSVGVSMAYMLYCWNHYPESKYKWYWNTAETKELLGFSGWHFLGTFSMSCRSQGINVLLNLFFNPAVNAARAIAFQVNSHIMQLETNFFTAIKPQIYKSYAKGEFDDLFKLIMRATIITTFLISIIAFPVLSGTSYILGLWLKEVPEYAVIFTQLALMNGLVDATNGPLAAAALATGKIRRYELILSTIYIANIPVSYIALKLGCDPTTTVVISILLSCVAMVARAYILRDMMGFPWKRYFLLVLKISFVAIGLYFMIVIFICSHVNGIFSFTMYSSIVFMLVTLLYWIILSASDKRYILCLIKEKVFKKHISH